jgi:hypothetical protein
LQQLASRFSHASRNLQAPQRSPQQNGHDSAKRNERSPIASVAVPAY